MTLLSRRRLLAAGFLGLVPGAALAQVPAAEDPWPSLAADLFDGRTMTETKSVIVLEAPYRAEDAALTPLTIRIGLEPSDARVVRAVTLVIDRNPVPLAAVFRLGPKAGIDMIATRVRVNENTAIHAVAELSDGTLYVTSKFVKAAGGCSAPSMKNADEAMASLGRMKLRQFPAAAGRREAQLMIRHPNSSGFQMDQLTRHYIPARYVSAIEIKAGQDLLLAVEGGISLSEDPNLRFGYRPTGAKTISARIVDTEGVRFASEWLVDAAGSQGT